MSQHTPGPWTVVPTPEGKYGATWCEIRAGRIPVVHAGTFTRHAGEEDECHAGVQITPADARLIAAAPELLTNGERLYNLLDDLYRGKADRPREMQSWVACTGPIYMGGAPARRGGARMIDFDGSELERKCRVLLGWDGAGGDTYGPLTDAERAYMVDDAYHCSPSFPPEEAPTGDDLALCRWWLAAMKEYVDCM